ncbi:hypothetical protein K4L06_18270 [Lysobacter sp. BMK333-48F3]|uniref:hypothetical protein n=1 Tax=Lysobacter sp. BMK333-48F3 TaxID=2867962 RepID=UPI001C8CD2D0|nr:hypothetical protein [Lysobacter sp. BMK333-48F3]MBX9403261.1 hypothetical protein [Lysobacter sp. BMK333-48F3]
MDAPMEGRKESSDTMRRAASRTRQSPSVRRCATRSGGIAQQASAMQLNGRCSNAMAMREDAAHLRQRARHH